MGKPVYKRGKEHAELMKKYLWAMYDPIKAGKMTKTERTITKYLKDKITKTEYRYLRMYYVEGVNYDVICNRRDVALGTVSRAVNRGDKKLLDVLDFLKELGVI